MSDVMTDIRVLAANEFVANILTGKTFDQIRDSVSRVTVGIIASAAGVLGNIIVGDTTALDQQEVSAANRFPEEDKDMNYKALGTFGDKVVISLRAPAGGATVRTLVKVDTIKP